MACYAAPTGGRARLRRMKRLRDHFRQKSHSARPQGILVGAFLATILAGTLLLWMPFASASGVSVPFDVALFTSTSATCVTGLSVVDIGSVFSTFGQTVILSLIQIGGVGIMTVATFLLIMLGQRLSVRSESVLATSIGEEQSAHLLVLLRRTIAFALVIEGLGTAVLAWRHWTAGCTPWRAIGLGGFHAVSAFCNAGFSPLADNLISLRHDSVYLTTILLLIVLGGIGFLVLHNVSQVRFWMRNRLRRGRVTAHSRMVLQTSLGLILAGMLLVGAMEWNRGFAGLTAREKLLGALFHSVSSRTAGFNAVPMGGFSEPSRAITMTLMFIGGSPGSTAGGIKTTTFLVLVLTVIAMIRGSPATRYGVRAIPETIVRESIVIFLLGIGLVTAIFTLLLLTENPPAGGNAALPLLFETVSAFGTVGFSLDYTPQLSLAGRLLIVLTMFIGRLGPLTMVLIVGTAGRSDHIHFPEEEVVVG